MNGKETMNNGSFSSQEGISLKEYVNDKFLNLEKAIDVRFDSVTQATNNALLSADKAITKSDIATEKRFDAVNEFRAVLTSQQNTFVPNSEMALINKTINERLDKIEKQIVGADSKGMGINQGISWLIAIVSFVITIVVLFLKIN